MMVTIAGRILSVMVILSLITVTPALADSINYITGFSVTASPLGTDQIYINQFDPTLGTLTKVHVSIQGALILNVHNAPNLIFGFPISYDYNIRVHQLFYGLASFFNFQNPGGIFNVLGHSNGAADIFTYTTLFSYNFDFTPSTDLAGGTIPATSNVIPPPFIEGLLADFIQGVIPHNQIDARQWLEWFPGQDSFGRTSPYPNSITSSAAGNLQIAYDYTPAAIPLPSTLMLLGSGLLGLVGLRAFRK